MRTPVPEYMADIVEMYRDHDGGVVADYIPELAAVDPTPLAVALCTPDGVVYAGGDCDHTFSIQSMSKPFAYALAMEEHGIDYVLSYVGVEPSGDPFNDISLDPVTGCPRNPMINIGAITTHALIGPQGISQQERDEITLAGLSAFAGRPLEVDEAVYESEIAESWRNQALANLVKANGKLASLPIEAVSGYVRQCAVRVTTTDLAVIAMTLGGGGVNPLTGQQVVSPEVAQQVLSVMATCGMYDSAGDWLSTVGIPAKSGVSGGILGCLPGQVGLGAFSPRLDSHGHSVRGVKLFEHLSRDLGLHLMNNPATSIEAIGQRTTTEDGHRLVALQGALTFSTAELALRHFAAIPPGPDDVYVDLTLVPVVTDIGERMLSEAIRRLNFEGHDVVLIDPHRRVQEAGVAASHERRIAAASRAGGGDQEVPRES